MKTLDQPREFRDEVITEVHRHKEAIAAEHNYDVEALLRGLRERQKSNARLVSRIAKGEQGAAGPHATRPESK